MVRELFGGALAGIYLFGSAVTGGLRVHSDVDVLVAVDRRPAQGERQALVARLQEISGRVDSPGSSRPIELTVVCIPDVVPWRYPPRTEFVYGEWLRAEFETGTVPEPARDPDLTIVMKKVVESSLPLFGPAAGRLLVSPPAEDVRRAMRDGLPTLLEGLEGDERNVVLTLARMWLTAAEGRVVPKDAAAEWASERMPPKHASLLNEARLAYIGLNDDGWASGKARLKALVDHMEARIKACLATV
ncbi:MAG: DUF4111 domain-containing protein [Ectothiorhodospiraceae bacterium]|nr:DUF4111 domain-containing protein [Ectothiorhodospiraceae bacterium]